jgi:hypothetical protein
VARGHKVGVDPVESGPSLHGPRIASLLVMRCILAVGVVLLSSCSPYVHSPPGRSVPLESSKALYPRETGLQFEGGGSAGADVGVPGFSLRVRHGIVKQLDGSAEFNFSSIRPDENREFVDASHFLMTGRVGLKYAIIDHVALTGGVAIGGWAGGAFVSPDLSLILAYENPKAVPFFSGGGWTSHPFNEKVVAISAGGSGGSPFLGVPVLTWGWTASTGLRVPLLHDHPPDSTPPSFLLGMSFRGAVFDEGDTILAGTGSLERRKEIYISGSIGFEYVFTPKKARSGNTN